ncbi:uncharacterized protein [Amphiura filiformis]|uniref:uncharacterized protein n=1 Tax=Amphiura filiformis TaxID=82378 RepID=UPI003B217486
MGNPQFLDKSSLRLQDDLPEDARQEEINWKLWVFAKRGNPHKVQECIDLGADVNYCRGSTVLHQAVQSLSIDTCQVLLQTGLVDINARTLVRTQKGLEEETAFLVALRIPGAQSHAIWNLCKLLIENGADVHIDNEKAFYIAVTTGNYEACKDLIEKHNVPVDTIYEKGQTALFSCGKYSYPSQQKVCNLLLEHKASVHTEDQDGLTPLQFALTNGATATVVESLIKAKSDVNKRFPDGKPMIAHVLEEYNWRRNYLKYLLNGGIDIEMQDENGYTALLAAVARMNNEVTKELLKLGADISAKDKDGNSVLHVWALNAYRGNNYQQCCSKLFQDLLEAEADLEYVNKVYHCIQGHCN